MIHTSRRVCWARWCGTMKYLGLAHILADGFAGVGGVGAMIALATRDMVIDTQDGAKRSESYGAKRSDSDGAKRSSDHPERCLLTHPTGFRPETTAGRGVTGFRPERLHLARICEQRSAKCPAKWAPGVTSEAHYEHVPCQNAKFCSTTQCR